MIPVPDERPMPYEVPWREVEHQESDDLNDDYAYRTLPIGTTREQVWDGDAAEERAWREEMKRLKEARERLGGFGFR